MTSKADVYNLALGLLLLSDKVSNPDTDKGTKVVVLNTHWNIALCSALEDMDLDSTSTLCNLSLVAENPIHHWKYAYKYPTNCAFFRRIQSHARIDSRSTHIDKHVAMFDGKKVIFTNHHSAVAEYIDATIPITSLAASAALCVAYRLAVLSAPLITGKGALKLIVALQDGYKIAKADAQAMDARENFVFVPEDVESEFVKARIE